jgi:hypothetical protein
MAQHLQLQTAVQNLSEATKSKILQNYAKVVQDRRTRRLKRVKSTVRQLYADGMSQAADELWDQCMNTAKPDYEDDQCSTSSEDWGSGKVRLILSYKEEPPDAELDPSTQDAYLQAIETIQHAYETDTLFHPTLLTSDSFTPENSISFPQASTDLADDLHPTIHVCRDTITQSATIFHIPEDATFTTELLPTETSPATIRALEKHCHKPYYISSKT